jgi:small subunit ribosomal protein S16
MAVKIRLQRRGRTKRPFYHIVVADARAPRDGRFIEKLGIYNPMTKPATIELDQMRAYEWLSQGAQPTDTARAILRFKGVLLYKHLMRGVQKGALTQEQADAKWKQWIDAKDAKIQARVAESAQEHADWLAKIDGTVKKVATKEVEVTSSDDKSPKKVSEQHKTLAEMAAEKAPAGLELATDAVKEEAAPEVKAEAEVKAPEVEELAETKEPAPSENVDAPNTEVESKDADKKEGDEA